MNLQTIQAIEDLKLQAAEAAAIAKFGSKIVKGSAKRGYTPGDGISKITVLINTVGLDGKPDGDQRRVATSDLHQVHHSVAVATAMKGLKAKAKRAQMVALLKQVRANEQTKTETDEAETDETETEVDAELEGV